jgi:hypothetical protein
MISRITSIAARRATSSFALKGGKAFVASTNHFNVVSDVTTKRYFFKASTPMMPIKMIDVSSGEDCLFMSSDRHF